MAQMNTTLCEFPECTRQRHTAHWCHGHWSQQHKGQEMRPLRQHNRVKDGRKRCTGCGETKPVSEFQMKSGRWYQHQCRRCRSMGWRMSKYGVDREFAERIADGAHCDVCGDFATGKQLHVDHCHDSGDVRGVLCNGCNTSIGLVGERPDVLRALADYLER